MLSISSATVSFNATSQTEDGQLLSSMTANYSDGSVFMNMTIHQNYDELGDDMVAFKDHIFEQVAVLNRN